MNVQFHKNDDPKWSYDEILNTGKPGVVYTADGTIVYLTIEFGVGKIRLLNLRSCQILDPDLFRNDDQIFRKMDFTTITLS